MGGRGNIKHGQARLNCEHTIMIIIIITTTTKLGKRKPYHLSIAYTSKSSWHSMPYYIDEKSADPFRMRQKAKDEIGGVVAT
jgi:hypothetical protein